MSTKFSVRPAPRKKPWICKRSPPCLIPPPYPASLLATFSLQLNNPPAPGIEHAGSLILTWRPVPALYRGTWQDGFKYFTCYFTYDTTTGHATASAVWDIGPPPTIGAYPDQEIPLPPLLLYHVEQVSTLPDTYLAALTITG